MLQGGKVRSKLIPILKDIEDVVYESSFVTEEGINMVIFSCTMLHECCIRMEFISIDVCYFTINRGFVS